MRRRSGDRGRGTRWLSAMACAALMWVTEGGASEPLVSPGGIVSSNMPSGSTNPQATGGRIRTLRTVSVLTPAVDDWLQSAREGNVFAINMVEAIFGQQNRWREFSHWAQRRREANADYIGDLSAAFTNQFQRERELAMAGDPFHQLMVGLLYERGVGTKKDYLLALEWYRYSAGHTNPLAQVAVGGMYAQAWVCGGISEKRRDGMERPTCAAMRSGALTAP